MASREIERANALLEKMAGHSAVVREHMDKMAGSIKAVGLVGAAVAGGVVAFFAEAEHAAVQYDEALDQLRVNAHLTAAATEDMGQAILKASLGTASSASDMADALAPIAGELARIQGGELKAADATQLLTAAQNLSVSSHMALGSATKAVTDLMLVYHQKVSDAASISDTLFQAHAQLGIGVDRLSMMLQRLQPRIAGSGVDMQHLLGIVREMGPAVGQGQRAMMLVGGVLQNLQNPSKGAQDAFAALGVRVRDAAGNFLGFGKAIDNIKAAYDRLPATANGSAKAMQLQADVALYSADKAKTQTKALRDQEATLKTQIQLLQSQGVGLTKSAFLQLIWGHNANLAAALVEGGSKGIDENTAALLKNGTAADATAVLMQDASMQMKMLPKTMHDIALSVGMVLLPALNRVLTPIVAVVERLAEWTTANPKLAATILAVVGGMGLLVATMAFAGPVIRGVGMAFSGLGSLAAGSIRLLLSPVGLLVGALVLLAGAFAAIPGAAAPIAAAVDTIRKALGDAFGSFVNFAGALLDLLRGTGTVDAVGKAFVAFRDAVVKALGEIVNAIALMLPKVVDIVATWARTLVPVVLQVVRDVIASLIAWIQTSGPGILAALATWTNAFIGWAQDVALPALVSVFGSIVDAIANFISSGAVYQVVNALATWAVQFLGWAATTGASVALSLIGSLGNTLITHTPEIVAGLVSLAGQIIGGIGTAILSHPAQIAEILFMFFAGSAVLGAVARAGRMIATALNDAMVLGSVFKEETSIALMQPFNRAAGVVGRQSGDALKAAMSTAGMEAGTEAATAMEAPLVSGVAADSAAAGRVFQSEMMKSGAIAGEEASASFGSRFSAGLNGVLAKAGGLLRMAGGFAALTVGGNLSESGAAQHDAVQTGLGGGLQALGGTLLGGPVFGALMGGMAVLQTQQNVSGDISQMASDIHGNESRMAQQNNSLADLKNSLASVDDGIKQIVETPLSILVAGDALDHLKAMHDDLTHQIYLQEHPGFTYPIRDTDRYNPASPSGPATASSFIAGSSGPGVADLAAIHGATTQLVNDNRISIAAMVHQSSLAALQTAGILQLHNDYRAAEAAAHAANATLADKLTALARAALDINKGVGGLPARLETLGELRALRAEAVKEHNTKAISQLDKLIGTVVSKVENSRFVNQELAKAQKIIDGTGTTEKQVAGLRAIQQALKDHGDTKAAGIIAAAVGKVQSAIKNHTVTVNTNFVGATGGGVQSRASGSSSVTVRGFAEGANAVAATGLALIHAGEMIIPAALASRLRAMGGLPALGASMGYTPVSEYAPPSKSGGPMAAGAFHLSHLRLEKARHGIHPAIWDAFVAAKKAAHHATTTSSAVHHAVTHAATSGTTTGMVIGVKAAVAAVAAGAKTQMTPALVAAMRDAHSGAATYSSGNRTMRAMATGVPFVGQDGPAYLHRGEAVFNVGQARALAQMGVLGGASGNTWARAWRTAAANRSSWTHSPISPGNLGGGGGGRPIVVNVYLDNRKVGHAVSKVLFEEERMYAGAASPGSPF